jgi:hypothetical protein
VTYQKAERAQQMREKVCQTPREEFPENIHDAPEVLLDSKKTPPSRSVLSIFQNFGLFFDIVVTFQEERK